MIKAWKWWLALAFVIVFFAGLATGLFAGAWHARHIFFVRGGGHFHDRMHEHIKRELRLTDEQDAKVAPILQRMSNRLEQIRNETDQRVAETMSGSHDEIVPLLTAEQREKLEQMRQRHLRMMEMHGGGRPHPGGHPLPSPTP